ncbi:MAG: hypothetical protein ACRCWF_18885 [Beijerinckiaceae bacterium]
MSSPAFRIRSYEVRAESRALMLKLRTERLATSRLGKAKEASLPVQAVEIVAEPAPQTVVAPVVAKAPAKPAEARIIVSRSIQAAAAPVEPVAVAEAAPAVAAETAPVEEIVAVKPVRKPAKPRARKAPVVAVVEALPEVSVEIPAAEVIAPEVIAEVPSVAAEVAPEIIEIPEEIAAAAPVVSKLKRTKKPVAIEAPVEPEAQPDHGPAVALQNAVAEAVISAEVRLPPREPKPSKRAMTSVAAVPSLGPGMVWRLNQIGIKTLQDMADIEADDLRLKLGSVAKLVRVENWIAFARAA